ncbi:hypothetical protein HZS_5838, partial [Henneguya salminicola]
MAEPKLYNLINNSSLFHSFLFERFKSSTRKRNLTQRNAERFLDEGKSVLRIDCLKCKSCKTTLFPRTGGFLTYLDSARRSNCKISTAKILQI